MNLHCHQLLSLLILNRVVIIARSAYKLIQLIAWPLPQDINAGCMPSYHRYNYYRVKKPLESHHWIVTGRACCSFVITPPLLHHNWSIRLTSIKVTTTIFTISRRNLERTPAKSQIQPKDLVIHYPQPRTISSRLKPVPILYPVIYCTLLSEPNYCPISFTAGSLYTTPFVDHPSCFRFFTCESRCLYTEHQRWNKLSAWCLKGCIVSIITPGYQRIDTDSHTQFDYNTIRASSAAYGALYLVLS